MSVKWTYSLAEASSSALRARLGGDLDLLESGWRPSIKFLLSEALVVALWRVVEVDGHPVAVGRLVNDSRGRVAGGAWLQSSPIEWNGIGDTPRYVRSRGFWIVLTGREATTDEIWRASVKDGFPKIQVEGRP